MNILMATDRSFEADLAEGRARLLATVLGAGLRLLHVIEDEATAFPSRSDEEVLPESSGELAELKVLSGDSCELISESAQDSDLLVIGEPRRRSTDGLFTGTTGERIIRRAAVPVLVVRTEAIAHYCRVVLAVDLSRQSVEIMRVGKTLKVDSAECWAINAYETPQINLMIQASSYSFRDVQQYISKEQRKRVRKLSRQMRLAGLSGRADAVMIESSPASTILGFAQRVDADLIIVGSRQRSNLAALALGSVARKVLGHSKADVLIVPPRR